MIYWITTVELDFPSNKIKSFHIALNKLKAIKDMGFLKFYVLIESTI